MKLISIIILILFIGEIINDGPPSCVKSGVTSVTKADDCSADSIAPESKTLDYTHCCFVEHKKGKAKECWAITSYQYENIGKLKKQLEENYSYDYKIDCNSSYLQICLILILSFILF